MSVPVVILLGSDSDVESFGSAFGRLRELEIPFAVEVTSAHRTPARTVELIRRFEGQGARVFIAAAGGAAHLPGVVASHTLLPVLVRGPLELRGRIEQLQAAPLERAGGQGRLTLGQIARVEWAIFQGILR